jgi:hypothetical protein
MKNSSLVTSFSSSLSGNGASYRSLLRGLHDAGVPTEASDRPRTPEYQCLERLCSRFQTTKQIPLPAGSYEGPINNVSGCSEACEKISANVLRRTWMVSAEDAEDGGDELQEAEE